MKERKPKREVLDDLDRKIRELRLEKFLDSSDGDLFVHFDVFSTEFLDLAKELRKGFQKRSPYSFETRINSHQVWIDEIMAQRLFASNVMDLCGAINLLSQEITNNIMNLLEDGEPSEDFVKQMVQQKVDAFKREKETLLQKVEDSKKDYLRKKSKRLDFIANKKPSV